VIRVAHVAVFLASAVGAWLALTALDARPRRREVSSAAAPATVAPTPRAVSPAPAHRRQPDPAELVVGRETGGSEAHDFDAVLERLKRADPWTASNFHQGFERAFARLVREAWAAHDQRDPAHCVAHAASAQLTVTVRATSDRLVVAIDARDDATRTAAQTACLGEYFAGETVIEDADIGGPFPEVALELTRAVPLRLSELLATTPP